MITITRKVAHTFEVTYLHAICDVRYWEDANVNGEVDTDGKLIPCRNGNSWEPIILLETGRIVNWKEGVTAKIHYKVCDAGMYRLLDNANSLIVQIDGYVPSIMCPEGNGYGDYVIMNIDEKGQIANWVVELNAFEQEDEDY